MGNDQMEIYRFLNKGDEDNTEGLHPGYDLNNNLFNNCCYAFSYYSPVLLNDFQSQMTL